MAEIVLNCKFKNRETPSYQLSYPLRVYWSPGTSGPQYLYYIYYLGLQSLRRSFLNTIIKFIFLLIISCFFRPEVFIIRLRAGILTLPLSFSFISQLPGVRGAGLSID